MVDFTTSHGVVSVDNWGYQLQGAGGSPLDISALADQTHDMFVIDFSSDGTEANAWNSQELSQLANGPGGNSLVVSYISIGEASEFRDHWRNEWTIDGSANSALSANAPSYLGPTNPDWPESRKVRFWESEWQDVIFNDAGTGWLDKIASQGFDAAYLDIVDAYYYWGAEVTPADQAAGDPINLEVSARLMIDFIIDMTAHARAENPNFFVILQNGEFILNDAGAISAETKNAFLDAVGGISVEDVYNSGNLDENNPFAPDEDRIAILKQDFLENDIPVFATDYVNTPALITAFEDRALTDGFIPYSAPDRDLDQIGDEAFQTHDLLKVFVCKQINQALKDLPSEPQNANGEVYLQHSLDTYDELIKDELLIEEQNPSDEMNGEIQSQNSLLAGTDILSQDFETAYWDDFI